MNNIELTPPPEAFVDVNDVNHMAALLVAWQKGLLQLLNHMKALPPGTEVSQEGQNTLTLEGDALAGFQLGLSLAIEELAVLPFSVIPEKEEDISPEKQDNPAQLVTSVPGG